MGVPDIYQALFGKKAPTDGSVIDLSEHGRVGGLSTGQAFKHTSVVDKDTGAYMGVNADRSINVIPNGSVVDTNNSTETPLLAGATFTGTAAEVLHFATIAIIVNADVASATNGMSIQFSDDGSDWHTGEQYTILAGATKFFTPPVWGRYFRIVYTNGATDQATFHIHTILKKTPIKWSSHNINDPIKDEDDAELIKAVITGKRADGTYDNASLTNGNNFKMSLEELESGVSSNSNTQLNVTQYLSNGNEGIAAADSASIDAFGRWRVSNPQTLFDSKNIFNDDGLADNVENQPLFYDNQETSGSGTGTSYNANESSQSMSVGDTTAGTRVRQTKMRFNYQPGKSQLVLLTFNMDGAASGITKREGIFDDQNGLFLELDEDNAVNFVRRSYATGSAVDNKVEQANWNLDKMDGTGASGVTLDWTKTQIMFIDYEWLGVGRVRMGFVVDGKIYYAHEFNNSNNLGVVYMSTPNLPLRSEISNDGNGAADTITQICSTVISEGGSQELGVLRYASTAGTHVDANTENTIYAVLGIRLKSEYIGASIKILNASIQIQTGSDRLEWKLILNPTVAGTFTYADQTNSAVQIAKGATANTVTGGIDITGGFAESGGNQSGNVGSAERGIDNALLLGSLIDGTVDSIVLAVRPIGGSADVDVEGSLTWRELV